MLRVAAASMLALACAGFFVAASLAQDKPAPKWAEILTPAKPELPKARAKADWFNDLDAALALARKEGRPLFITFRCLPCKQSAKFDADVMDGGDELTPLLRQFITVRLTSMRNIDTRLLPFEGYQDMDLSWWGYFLSDTAQLYGVYGGRDEVSDTSRVSEKGLIDALSKVLAHHYDARRASWGIDAPAPDLAKGKARTPKQFEGWSAWAKRGHKEADDGECLHCHQVNEVIRQPVMDAKKFDKHEDFFGWPFPENIGLTLDRDKGLVVAKVQPGSAAAKAGVLAGDEIGAAAGRRLFTQTDLRGVLHRLGKGDKDLELVWLNKGQVKTATLKLKGEWHKSDLSWRKSVADADTGAHFGFPWPLRCSPKERGARNIAKGKMCVKPFFPKGPAGAAGDAGLKSDDFIVAINGEDPDICERAFVVWFKLKFEPGDEVKLTVMDPQGKTREVKYKAPGRDH